MKTPMEKIYEKAKPLIKEIMEETKLKLCPFCKAIAQKTLHGNYVTYNITHTHYCIMTKLGLNKHEILSDEFEAWNTRI